MTLSAPLTPADLDLRDFAYMPVDIGRLFGSEFHAAASDAEWRAGMTLWLKSYHQVPGASVPDDDVALARLAEFGRDIKGWRKVKTAALRGWVKCSDSRLYHPVVAEKALEGWLEKLAQRRSGGAGNAKRWGTEFDPSAIDAAIVKATEKLLTLNPQSRSLFKRRPAGIAPRSQPDPNPIQQGSQPDVIGTPVAIAREGKGREGNILDAVAEAARVPLVSNQARDLADELAVIAGHDLGFIPPGWCGAAMRVQTWISSGWPREIIVAATRSAAAKKHGAPANSVQFFEKAIAEEVARQAAPLPQVEIHQPETIKVTANGKQQRGNVLQAADRILDRIRSFDACPDDTDGIRGEPDEATPRLLSQR